MSYPSAPVPKPGVIPLRPLGVGDILGGAVATIRTRPLLMLGMTAVVVTVAELITLAATYPMARDLAAVPIDEYTRPEDLRDVFLDSAVVGGIVGVIVFLSRILLSGFVTVVVGTAVIGRPQTVREAWAATRPRLLPLLGLTMVFLGVGACVGLVVFGLALLLGPLAALAGIAAFVVGVWLMVLFAFAPTALVLENAGVRRAFGRSRQLVRGSWWRMLGILLLASVIGGFVAFVVDLLFLAASGQLSSFASASPLPPTTSGLVWTTIGAIVASVATEPFIAATTVLLYTDQRIRREGLATELTRVATVQE